MVGDIDVLEESANTGWVEDLDSVGWHLVSDEVEGEVDVLKEEGYREETIEELARGFIFSDLHPDLHLLTVCTLDEVVRVSEVHVLRPHAPKLVWGSARVLCQNIKHSMDLHR